MPMMTTSSKESPYQWVINRDGYRTLIRTKHPRLAIEVQDDADDKQIADALKKAAEFVMKGDRKGKEKPMPRVVVRKNGLFYAVGAFESDSMEGEYVGDVCDLECNTDCGLFCAGTCPYITKRMADGELVKVGGLIDN